ncbi:MAG: dephospho-CoA kinase [Myxococcota bacterium]
MELWGLTGGIASGKSTVSRMLRAHGATIIDADALAREVVAPGTEGLAAVVERFGPDVLLPDGSLDRKKLGERVFSDATARADLNAITHPRIAQLALQRTAEAEQAGARVVVYDAPLLVENRLHELMGMKQVLVVACSRETQLRRLMQRDGLTLAQARARLAAQLPLSEKKKAATVVFQNDGKVEDLQRQVDQFWTGHAPGSERPN